MDKEGSNQPVIYFDIGDTLGSAVITHNPLKLVGLDVFPFVPPILEKLHSENIRLGIISNTIPGDTAEDMQLILENAELYRFFDPDLLLYSSVTGIRKDSPLIFKHAARISGNESSPENCIFVGENAQERHYAKEAGLHVAASPQALEDLQKK